MRICFDLDETLCTGRPYVEARPIKETIDMVNHLKSSGHTIIIHTARGMKTSNGDADKAEAIIGDLTLTQLEEWGIQYDEVVFGKPCADIYIDDKACNVFQLLNRCEDQVDKLISKLEGFLGDCDAR